MTEISVIKLQMQLHTFDPLYIFTGEELEVQKRYIEEIAKRANKPLKSIDTVADLYKVKGNSLFNEFYTYVCFNDTDFMKSEKAWETVKGVIGENILILVYSKIDKRGKFLKAFEDACYEFTLLDKELLIKYIKKDTKLSDYNCDMLVDMCENSYGRILTEIDKIKQYQEASKDDSGSVYTDDHCFQYLVGSGIIHRPPTDAIFDFVNAVFYGKPRKSFKLLEECKELGEPSLRLLLVLYNTAKHLLQVQACDSSDISKSTGLSAWEIKNVQGMKGIYSNGELVNALRLIRWAEQGIKTGQIEEDMAVEYVLINIL